MTAYLATQRNRIIFARTWHASSRGVACDENTGRHELKTQLLKHAFFQDKKDTSKWRERLPIRFVIRDDRWLNPKRWNNATKKEMRNGIESTIPLTPKSAKLRDEKKRSHILTQSEANLAMNGVRMLSDIQVTRWTKNIKEIKSLGRQAHPFWNGRFGEMGIVFYISISSETKPDSSVTWTVPIPPSWSAELQNKVFLDSDW